MYDACTLTEQSFITFQKFYIFVVGADPSHVYPPHPPLRQLRASEASRAYASGGGGGGDAQNRAEVKRAKFGSSSTIYKK